MTVRKKAKPGRNRECTGAALGRVVRVWGHSINNTLSSISLEKKI